MFSSSTQPMLYVYKIALNRYLRSMGFSKPHHWSRSHLSYLPTAATTLMIITRLICAGRVMFGKLNVYRCVRTEADNRLSFYLYSVLVEGIMFVHCGRQHTNFIFCRNDMYRKAVCKKTKYFYSAFWWRYPISLKIPWKRLSSSTLFMCILFHIFKTHWLQWFADSMHNNRMI